MLSSSPKEGSSKQGNVLTLQLLIKQDVHIYLVKLIVELIPVSIVEVGLSYFKVSFLSIVITFVVGGNYPIGILGL